MHLTVQLEAGSKRCRVDRQLIRQAILAVAARATKHAGQGGDVRIETRTENLPDRQTDSPLVAGCYHVISICDTGSAQDPRLLDRIFEPFLAEREFATGDLELAAAYGIVSQSGGHIDFRSKSGEGDTFTLLLPQV